MFFLGISAHLLIYLLVPAFLVVCFYFRGTAGSSEVVTLLPEVVVYKQISNSYSKCTYVYQVEKQQEKEVKKATFIFNSLLKSETPLYILSYYLSPTVLSKTLRAPPALY